MSYERVPVAVLTGASSVIAVDERALTHCLEKEPA